MARLMELSDDELLRYNRHIMLPQIDVAGQQRLKQATVLLIGVGGLGSPVAMYLAASGVGQLVLVDDDEVDLSNLQRQIVHATDDINASKVESAKQTITQLNPEVTVQALAKRLTEQELAEQVQQADVVVDASDNLATRLAVNKACVAHAKPLVSGAAIAWEGQLGVFNASDDAACYQCVYKQESEQNLSCSESGVISPLVGIVGSAMALEAVKLIAQVGKPLTKTLLMFDALNHHWQPLQIAKNKNCSVCS